MKIVVALGGNALGQTAKAQHENLKSSVVPIVDLIEEGHDVILTHGNGPQVGMIKLAMDAATELNQAETMPITECVAMSQGYIGYHLQRYIRDELARRSIAKEVVTIVTEVIVDGADPAFTTPNKPIGAFYTKEEAERFRAQGYVMMEDAGRGYRHVVASPKPVDIVQKSTIEALVKAGEVVITVGGGGIPISIEEGRTISHAAVIDKDHASAKLAEIIDADFLLILTEVEQVALHFGEPNEERLSLLDEGMIEQYREAGEFAPGSMLPKVEAALNFAKSKPGRSALITSLEKAKEGFAGETGTRVVAKIG